MHALNDLAMIKLETKRFTSDDKETAESGILTSLPDQFNFFGMWSFAFENSFMERERLDTLYQYWESKIGQKVFWTALSERGNIITNDEGRWAFVKLTSLIAIDEPTSKAQNVHSDGGGSFGLEK